MARQPPEIETLVASTRIDRVNIDQEYATWMDGLNWRGMEGQKSNSDGDPREEAPRPPAAELGHPRSSLSTFILPSLQPPRFSPVRRPENSITMALQRSSASWLSSTLAVLAILCLSVPANALYFYMGEGQTKCFFEELPKDTLVVGAYHLPQSFWCFFM